MSATAGCDDYGNEDYAASTYLTITILCGCRSTLTVSDQRDRLGGVPAKLAVSGRTKRSKPFRRVAASGPTKRSSRLAGRRPVSTGGMKAPRPPSHNGVRTNASVHQARQRSRVRKGTPSPPASTGAAEFEPACRLELRTTISAKYTRRPRKRTEAGVLRVRQI